MNKSTKIVLVVILCLSVIISAYSVFQRIKIENQNKTVEICVDINDVKKISTITGLPNSTILKKLKSSGATSIALAEETAVNSSDILWVPGYKLAKMKHNYKKYYLHKTKIFPYYNYLLSENPKLLKNVKKQLAYLIGNYRVKLINRYVLVVKLPEDELMALGFGINPNSYNYVKKLGFHVIPRLRNSDKYNHENITETFVALSKMGKNDLVIFDKKEILGYPDNIAEVATALKLFGLKFGYLEVSKQDGGDKLARLMKEKIVRVHSIPHDEIKEMKITKNKALARYLRAIRERNVRLLYVHPFVHISEDKSVLNYNLQYVKQLKALIEKEGFKVGISKAPDPLRVADWQIFILSLGALIGLILVVKLFINIPDWIIYFIIGLVILFNVTLLSSHSGAFLQKLWALVAAISFPSWAIISQFNKKYDAVSDFMIIPKAGLIILNVLADTLLGVIIILGLLSDSSFMLGGNVFVGVKLALIFPILIVGCYFLINSFENDKTWREKIMAVWNLSIPVKGIIIMFAALVVALVLLARSGNFNIPVPGFEKGLRQALENILMVRPRTKEFLIGYPALFLAAFLFLKNRAIKWWWLILIVGTIAPISVINTFCHIHTPLLLSIIRTLNGLVLGMIVGLVLSVASNFIIK